MRLLKIVLLLSLICTSISFAIAQTGDGIPDNCEANPDYAHQFVRCEAHNRRLVLVDWNTGNELNTIASDLDNTIITGWSISCQYIAGAVGSPDSMDTVVWNVQSGERMGSVPDAHNQAHHITWGPGDYLVVETRHGAILWHVPSYRQVTLTTHYDPVTVRNFIRLRWDIANAQLIANLSGGGRVVYDLNTGQEVPVVAQRSDPFPGEPKGQVIVGSAPYDCNGGYRYGYRYWYSSQQNAPNELALRYDVNTRQVYVDLYNNGLPQEVLVVLENDFTPASFQVRGWSADCRYVAASIGRAGEDVSDTYVWDVTTGQRVGILEDARVIVHPLTWHPTQPVLLAETRHGAVLWYLPDGTQSLLDTGAETALTGFSDLHNFSRISWTEDSLYIETVGDPEIVQVYNLQTGELLDTLSNDGSPLPSIQSSPASVRHETTAQMPVSTSFVIGETGYSENRNNCSGRYFNGQVSDNPLLFQYSIYDGSSYLFSLQTRGWLSWSPDCRWLYGEVPFLNSDPNYDNAPIDDSYRESLSDYLLFWNATTGEQIQLFYHPYRFQTYSSVSWSPDSSRAIVRTTEGAYLYDLTTNTTRLLVFNRPSDALRSYARVFWDFERGFFLIEGWTAVYAFDIGTGAFLYEFTSHPTTGYRCGYWGCTIRILDNQYLILGDSGTIGVSNLDTLESYFISTRTEEQWWRIRYTRFHVSPSEHYLISVRRDGTIAVWDLENLEENVDERLPYFVHLPDIGYGFDSIRFIDDATVEITQFDGTSYQLSIVR